MQEYIRNPKTGRPIKVGGPTYIRLLKTEGIKVTDRTQYPVTTKKSAAVGSPIGPTKSRVAKTLVLPIYTPTKASAPRTGAGSATRGWGKRAPKRGRPRKKLYEVCGEACFLGENMAFPICPACDNYDSECKCEIDCSGANAAFIRSQQWNYPGVSAAAQRVLREKCKRTPTARKTF